VLTCTGEAFASRVAASLLNAIDLPELITSTQEDYEALAIELAMNPERLKAIRQKLQNNRLTTPLFDSKRFTQHIEDAYIKMYQRYQADLPPEHIDTVAGIRSVVDSENTVSKSKIFGIEHKEKSNVPPSKSVSSSQHYAVTVIQPPGYVHSMAFWEVAETLHFALENMGIDSIITDRVDVPGRFHIVLGANLIDKISKEQIRSDSIIYNFEQMDPDSPWLDEVYLNLLRKHKVWDYSARNIALLKEKGVANIDHLPLGYVRQLERIKPAVQDIDVLFYGSINPRRKAVIDALKAENLNVVHVFGTYRVERDALIARSKIVLNLHFYESKIFEIARVSYLLTNGVCVVSESGLDPIEDDFKQSLVFAPYCDLTAACVALVNDTTRRRTIARQGQQFMRSLPEEPLLERVLLKD